MTIGTELSNFHAAGSEQENFANRIALVVDRFPPRQKLLMSGSGDFLKLGRGKGCEHRKLLHCRRTATKRGCAARAIGPYRSGNDRPFGLEVRHRAAS